MKSQNVKNKTTEKLVVSAIMVALSTVLSFIKFGELPYGGSVTLFSFVPLLFVGYAYGFGWGAGAGAVYGILQTIFGISGAIAGAGFKWWQVVLCALLDYIVAGVALGSAGVFKKSVKSPSASFGLGAFVACLLKYASHFLSGYILFGGWAEWFFGSPEDTGFTHGAFFLNHFSGNALSAIYSLVYNGLFMIPEIIISVIMVIILINVKPIRKAAGV